MTADYGYQEDGLGKTIYGSFYISDEQMRYFSDKICRRFKKNGKNYLVDSIAWNAETTQIQDVSGKVVCVHFSGYGTFTMTIREIYWGEEKYDEFGIDILDGKDIMLLK